MNKPNPLVPQGTFPDKGKAQIRITVFAILAVHVVMLGVLLIAGCNRKTQDQAQAQDTGLPPVPPPPVADTNWPSAPGPAATQEVARLAPAPVPDAIPPTPAPQVEPPAAGLTEHTISKGESFYTLGKKYGVGFKAIADANPGVNPNRLKIGDKVKIPPPKTPGAPSANGAVAAAVDSGPSSYTVKSGDNLMKIAKAYGVTVKQLRTANNLKTDQIKVGQTLKIPPKAMAEAAPPVPAAPAAVPPGFAQPQ